MTTLGSRHPSTQSLKGLDGLNFFMADVSNGLGPFLSVFLKGNEHWQAGGIGLAMAASSVSAAIFQVPAGALVDWSRAKRGLAALSGLVVAGACLLIAFVPTFPAVLGAQVLVGVASAIIPPVLAALSLGLVGHRRLDGRISRNAGFNHGGNFVAALLAGAIGHWFGFKWIFYLVCIFAAASAGTVALIRPREIDHDLARGGETRQGKDGRLEAEPIKDLLKNRTLIVFLIAVLLFHSGNAAMLPMAGQVLAKTHPGTETIALAACIVMAQFVMIGVAWAVGRLMQQGVGRKTIFVVAYAVLPIRGLLFAFIANPIGIVAIQMLDGVASGIFGIVAVVIAADIMDGTGRFNLAQGLVALAVGVGAGLSNVVSGYVVQGFGYRVGFLFLAAVALAALAFFAALMPETKRLPAAAGAQT